MLLGFQARFAPMVESGEKTQTIRALRKDGRVPRIGERLYLYTGLRTKKARKLGEGEVIETFGVQLARDSAPTPRGFSIYKIMVPGVGDLALADGFASTTEMLDWFDRTHGLPFTGTLIRWRLLPPPSPPAGQRREGAS